MGAGRKGRRISQEVAEFIIRDALWQERDLWSDGKNNVYETYTEDPPFVTCVLQALQTDRIVGVGSAKYNEGDEKDGVEYRACVGRKLAKKRAIDNAVDRLNKAGTLFDAIHVKL